MAASDKEHGLKNKPDRESYFLSVSYETELTLIEKLCSFDGP